MNKGIAHILMTKLSSIPFMQKCGGLVFTHTQQNNEGLIGEGGKTAINKFPASQDFIINTTECFNKDEIITFTPDASYTGMFYFEDRGVSPLGRKGKLERYKSKLRLIVWLNGDLIRKHVNGDEISSYSTAIGVTTAIKAKLSEYNFKNEGYYQRINIKEAGYPVADSALFSKYKYDFNSSQYLMPPFEYFAIDLEIEYSINPNCIDKIALMDYRQTAILYNSNNTGSYISVGGCGILAYRKTTT